LPTFSDSLSILNSIANKKLEHPITLKILLKYHNLSINSFNIIFCWLPSHVSIPGNEKADKTANSALNKWIRRLPVPYTDLKPIIMTSGNNFGTHEHKINSYQIYPTIPSYSTLPYFSHRKDQILYNRLHIGHTFLTHSYLIEHINPPKCIHYNQLLSV